MFLSQKHLAVCEEIILSVIISDNSNYDLQYYYTQACVTKTKILLPFIKFQNHYVVTCTLNMLIFMILSVTESKK